MRLSTVRDRDDDRAIATLAAALDGGVALLDTADAYALDDSEVGHNERLIARAIATLPARPEIVTKGGLVRPDGAWVPNGRARHLTAAARASRERLGAIDLYLLHAPDPRVELATSVRALARLRDDGVVRAIGLSDVNRVQLEAAIAIAPIAAIEIELSPWKLDAVRAGLVAFCAAHGIRVLAHRPLGGPAGARRLARDPVFARLGVDATPAEIALAWLASLGTVPLPGASSPDTARSIARANRLVLDGATRDALAAHYLAVGSATPRASSAPAEVVAIVGMPGAGKSTHARDFVARGYLRLNRDERGGSLRAIAEALDEALAAGAERVVLDNTYGTRAARAEVVEIAHRHGARARCLVMQTPLEDAQYNVAARALRDAIDVAPNALFRFRRAYEPPRADEGWDAIEDVPFVRAPSAGSHAGTIVELDRIVWVGRPRIPSAIRLVDGARDRLAALLPHVAGTTWQPGGDDIDALAARLAELLGFVLPIAACTHLAGPPVCWCRKPMPGLALVLARRLDLDLARSTHVGASPADLAFAARAGMRYVRA